LLLVVVGVSYVSYQRGVRGELKKKGRPVAAAAAAQGSIWTCAMHPQIRKNGPGKCPICGMELIPVTASSGGLRSLTVSPASRALMNIETAPVERKYVTHEVAMVGKVAYDETRLVYITAWVPGRLDRLYVDYTGVAVRKGDHMVWMYSPDLVVAQQELIQAVRSYRRLSQTEANSQLLQNLQSSREKLRLLGLLPDQIQEIEKRGTTTDHMTIYAPAGGVVVHKNVNEGMYVKTGTRIYTIADLSHLWIYMDAYESDIAWLRYGQLVEFSTEAYPGEVFKGRIAFIQPVLDDKTRTIQVRVNIPNPNGKLKPEMFGHGKVHVQVAADGVVFDPGLAGKWIGPMHPEIVKDEPGKCDICGMPLVRAETLGYVDVKADKRQKPLVIPASAALVTGTRAVVYVELPPMPAGLNSAWDALAGAVASGEINAIHETFAAFGKVLDKPYDQLGTMHAVKLWNDFADRMSEKTLTGQRVLSLEDARRIFEQITEIVNEAKEQFAPAGEPTFEGREILLGPRVGDYYLVRNGLTEGQLVVTHGAFKIDAEIQIQAKPSMMTPAGGGGGAHGGSGSKAGDKKHAGRQMALPTQFQRQIEDLVAAYDEVTADFKTKDLEKINAVFQTFGKALERVDARLLTGQPKMQWKEFAMLLSNDAAEGSQVKLIRDADRVYLSLKSNMRRMRGQLGVPQKKNRAAKNLEVSQAFQQEIAKLWKAYLAVQQALAGDDFEQARRGIAVLRSEAAHVQDQSLNEAARHVWNKEKANLGKIVENLEKAEDIQALRTAFAPLSDELSVLVKTFGLGNAGNVFQLHCPMALHGQGAIWLQDSKKTRNPYYGSAMLGCKDRVEQISGDDSQTGSPSHDHTPSN